MDKQEKLFDINYLTTRIRELKEVRRNEVRFEITKSDRVFSKSLYVTFYCQSSHNQWFKESSLRISDHEQKDCPHTQLIVKIGEDLTKKKKAQLMAALGTAIRRSKTKHLYKEIYKTNKGGENEQGTDL